MASEIERIEVNSRGIK